MNLATRASIAIKAFQGLFDSRKIPGILELLHPGASEAPKRGTRQLLDLYNTCPAARMVVLRAGTLRSQIHWFLATPEKAKAHGRRERHLRRLKTLGPGDPDARGLNNRHALQKAMLQSGDLREITDHPFLTLLDEPAPGIFTGGEFRHLDVVWEELVGESFWWLVPNGAGVPSGALLVPPWWVQELPSPQDPFFRVSFSGWQERLPATWTPDGMMIWRRELDPVHPYHRGSGLGRAAADEFEGSEMAAKAASATFRNKAIPPLLIYGPDFPGPQRKAMEEGWLGKLQGFWRAGLPMFFETPGAPDGKPAISIMELRQNLEQLQLVEYTEAQRKAIIQIWGFPPEIFGVLSNSNRSTIDAAADFAAMYYTVPKCETWRQWAQSRMVNMYDSRLILDYESPLRADPAVQLQYLQAAPWAAQVDEVRTRQGFHPLDGGRGQVHVMRFGDVVVPYPGGPQVGAEPPPDPEPPDPAARSWLRRAI